MVYYFFFLSFLLFSGLFTNISALYELSYATLFGDSSCITYGFSVAYSSSVDAVFISGSTNGNFSTYTNKGLYDVIVQRYSTTGVLAWTVELGSDASDNAYDIDVDSSGNSYVAIQCNGAFNGETAYGGYDMCFVKISATGTVQYTIQFGDSGNQIPNGIVVDRTNGYFYVAGHTGSGSTSLGGVGKTATNDLIWIKYETATGTRQSFYRSGGTCTSGYNQANAIVVDSSGNTIHIGQSTCSVYMTATNNGGQDVILEKMTASTGAVYYTKLYGGTADDYGLDIAIDTSDNLYGVGYSTSTTVDDQTNNGGEDILIYKFNSSGITQYTILAGGTGNERGSGIAVDTTNGVFYVTGYTYTTSFYSNTCSGSYCSFLLVYSMSSGSLQSATLQSSTTTSYSYAVTYGNNLLYSVGYTKGTFNSQTLTGTQDGYLAGIYIVAPTNAPTRSPTTASPTRFPTAAPTNAPTRTPTQAPSFQPTLVPTVVPTRCPTNIPTQPPTFAPTLPPTLNPTQSPTRIPTLSPTFAPTYVPTQLPSFAPTRAPTVSPTIIPTIVPTVSPTRSPTNTPTQAPTYAPTQAPTLFPTALPTYWPTYYPTQLPSLTPTHFPTQYPTSKPSHQPSTQPTSQPTYQPTNTPSSQPTHQPINPPSSQPSVVPSVQPSMQPSGQPTVVPSSQPSGQPSGQPSVQPSKQPSCQPSGQPSSQPSVVPSVHPFARPSLKPSFCVTVVPTELPSKLSFTRLPTAFPTISPTQEIIEGGFLFVLFCFV